MSIAVYFACGLAIIYTIAGMDGKREDKATSCLVIANIWWAATMLVAVLA